MHVRQTMPIYYAHYKNKAKIEMIKGEIHKN